MSRSGDDSFICAVSRTGTGSPLFIVPSAGMTPLSLINLARSIEPPRPVYSFEFAGLEGDRRPHDSVEDMASAYVAEIRRVQPTGPYYIGGHCFGGIVAHDIVTKLEALNARVAVLLLFDSFGPVPASDDSPADGDLDQHQQSTDEMAGHIEKGMELLNEHMAKQFAILPPPVAKRFVDIIQNNLATGMRYQGRPVQTRIALLRTRAHDKQAFLGWRMIAGGGYSDVEVPGDTFSMLRPPHAKVLGKHLSDILTAEE